MNARPVPRSVLAPAAFTAGLAVVFAGMFGVGRVVPPVLPTPPAVTDPQPASTPADHPPMSEMTGTTGLPG